MPLLAHLTEADLRRYVAGARSLQTERHARVCIWCMHRLADAAMRVACWERRGPLQRLVKIDPAHEIDELLAQIEEDRRRHAA
jgi:hypothetical protein